MLTGYDDTITRGPRGGGVLRALAGGGDSLRPAASTVAVSGQRTSASWKSSSMVMDEKAERGGGGLTGFMVGEGGRQ